jgi:hypothetical protein
MEDMMTRPRHILFALSALAVSTSAAQANFFFEGLDRFSERHCIVFEPTLEDPDVAAPPAAEYGTPGAWSVDERPYAAPACVDVAPGKFDATRDHRAHHPKDPVPQK